MPKKSSKKTASRKRKSVSPKSGGIVVHRYIYISLGVFLVMLTLANIPYTKNFSGSSQSVLGEDREEEQRSEDNSGSGKNEDEKDEEEESQDEQQKKEEEGVREEVKRQEEVRVEASKNPSSGRTSTKSNFQFEGDKMELEQESENGDKLKIKVEDDKTTKVELRTGELKIKYVIENGQVKVKTENEAGDEVELAENEQQEVENEVEEELEKEGIEIASSSGSTVILRRGIGAKTTLPISINVGTKQLIVTTPAGQKIVAVLPDQAISRMLAAGFVDSVDGAEGTSSATLSNIAEPLELETKNNVLVYKIKGKKEQKLLGFIPLTLPKTVFVSAQTNNVVSQEQSVLAEVVDLLSP